MPTAFSELLRRCLDRSGLSDNAFAKAVGYKNSGHLAMILAGRRTPPLDRMERWADVLAVKGAERARFLDLAALAHLPEEVRERFEQMRDEHERLAAMAAEIVRRRQRS